MVSYVHIVLARWCIFETFKIGHDGVYLRFVEVKMQLKRTCTDNWV